MEFGAPYEASSSTGSGTYRTYTFQLFLIKHKHRVQRTTYSMHATQHCNGNVLTMEPVNRPVWDGMHGTGYCSTEE